MRKTAILTGAAALALVIGSPAQAGPVPDSEPNDTQATAQSLDGNFTLDADADIESSTTIPHVTVTNSNQDGYDWFSFNVATGGTIGIFDIDHTNFDAFLDLFDGSGNRLQWNDDYTTLAGAGGSTTSLDSYMQYTFANAGTYAIRVGNCCFSDSDGVQGYGVTPGFSLHGGAFTGAYELNVSLQAPGSAVPEPATWAMMLIGFGAVGASMRQQKRREALAVA